MIDSTLRLRKPCCQLAKTARDLSQAAADGLDSLKEPARVGGTQRMHRVVQREGDLLLAGERGGKACLCINELGETP
ncbi:MAG: hypothetical protein ACYDC9_02430 [Dermatophilaceae bacterium]